MDESIVPAHRWTNGGQAVRILKCVDPDRRGHGGFLWPESGPVVPDNWSREPTCESGGLFGWAWGLCFGDGKEPDYGGLWIVFEAHPDDVVCLGGKVKAVPNPELSRTPVVIFCGSHARANQLILDGQVAWVRQASSGAASATGPRGAASATGSRSIAAVTGECATVEAGSGGVAVAVVEECWWVVRGDAVFVQRWAGGLKVLTSQDVGAADGDRLRFFCGEVVERKVA